MFSDEILHYLAEFKRVLKQEGRVWATCFIVNEEILKAVHDNPQPDGPHTGWNLSFLHQHGSGCFVNVATQPRQSVAYEESCLLEIINQAGLILDQPMLWGNWSGAREYPKSGQDVVILRKPCLD